MYFRFFACKNYNVRVIMLAIDIVIAMAFLSNIFLVIFAFFIADMRIVAISILNRLYIFVFAFLFIKIVIQV